MSNHKLKILLIISVLLNLSFVCGMIYGHYLAPQPKPKMRSLLPGFRGYTEKRAQLFREKMNLTPEQEKAFQDNIHQYKNKREKEFSQRHNVSNDILEEILSADPSEVKIQELINAMPVNDIYRLIIEERLAVAKILTPRQRQKLLQYQQQVRKEREKRFKE